MPTPKGAQGQRSSAYLTPYEWLGRCVVASMVPLKQVFVARPPPEDESLMNAQWRLVACNVASVDLDIEMSVRRLQKKHGCTLAAANIELVQKLSFAL